MVCGASVEGMFDAKSISEIGPLGMDAYTDAGDGGYNLQTVS